MCDDAVLMFLVYDLMLFTLATHEEASDRKKNCRTAVARANKATRRRSQCPPRCRYWARSVATHHTSPNKMRRADMRRSTCRIKQWLVRSLCCSSGVSYFAVLPWQPSAGPVLRRMKG